MANPIKRLIRVIGTPFFRARGFVAPEVEYIDVKLKDLPTAFDGYRIAVVADLHLPDSFVSPAQVLDTLRTEQANCILLAGDLTNRYHDGNLQEMSAFLQQLAAIAPCIAIVGNHEYIPQRLATYQSLLTSAQIPLLCDQYTTLEHKGQGISLYGVYERKRPLPTDVPSPALLLTHYPHHAARHADSGFALAVCGHAHGGQVRFKNRGLYAPGQGFFAKYISGLYRLDNMQMVVSRGLGDSSLPIRLHNPPHLPIITLKAEQ